MSAHVISPSHSHNTQNNLAPLSCTCNIVCWGCQTGCCHRGGCGSGSRRFAAAAGSVVDLGTQLAAVLKLHAAQLCQTCAVSIWQAWQGSATLPTARTDSQGAGRRHRAPGYTSLDQEHLQVQKNRTQPEQCTSTPRCSINRPATSCPLFSDCLSTPALTVCWVITTPCQAASRRGASTTAAKADSRARQPPVKAAAPADDDSVLEGTPTFLFSVLCPTLLMGPTLTPEPVSSCCSCGRNSSICQVACWLSMPVVSGE